MRNIAIPSNQHGWLGFLLDRSSAEDNANKPCEMLVTVTHSGVKDFAVALQKGSELRWALFKHLPQASLRNFAMQYIFEPYNKQRICNAIFVYLIVIIHAYVVYT